MRRLIVVLALAVLPLASLTAQERPAGNTLMTEPGKLLHREDLSQTAGKGWTKNKGKWEIVDSGLRGAELPSDMHGAVMRLALPFTAAVIQYEFKLGGARTTTLSINAVKGHLCRVVINADGFHVQKDKSKTVDGDKPAVLDRCKVAIAPGAWHTLSVELRGKEMLAALDGKHIAFGAHDGIDAPKANIGLTVAGESVSFRNLTIWEADANPSWDATRSRLLQTRKTQGTVNGK
jgi:hypothetical protein